MRGVLGGLVTDPSRMIVVDLEAGLEHLSRGTARHVDTLLVVGEPYFKSLETAQRSFVLARDLGLGDIRMVGNKIRNARDEATVREYAARHDLPLAGLVPWDDAVAEADQRGLALMDHASDAPAVVAVRRLADLLVAPAAV